MNTLREYLDREVVPHADAWDREQRIPRAVVEGLGAFELFGAIVERESGGQARDPLAWGEDLEALGGASISLLSLLTVHTMCAQAIDRWGEPEQKRDWLPALAAGRMFGAFALTEPDIGCDAKNVQLRLEEDGDGWRVTGRKRWISGAQVADVFLALGQTEHGPTAILVPRQSEGLEVVPIGDMLGFRAAQLGELRFNGVNIPKSLTIGRVGLGFTHVAGAALDAGRFCVACGCTGLIRACLRASVDYARVRKQFDVPLREHQLIQEMIANMATSYKAARALWRHAAEVRAKGDPNSISETTVAKYFATTAATRAASDALQIHGANGCGSGYPVQRYFRDARIGEIIEGSNQMQQLMIAHRAMREFATPGRKSAQ